jgi:hypothetical protein
VDFDGDDSRFLREVHGFNLLQTGEPHEDLSENGGGCDQFTAQPSNSIPPALLQETDNVEFHRTAGRIRTLRDRDR